MAMPTTHRTNDHTTQSLALTNGSTFGELFGIAMPMLHDLNSQKCNNHLVSFIKVVGLFVSYIVAIFDTIKSEMTV